MNDRDTVTVSDYVGPWDEHVCGNDSGGNRCDVCFRLVTFPPPDVEEELPEIDVTPEEYPFVGTDDERLRCFVFEHMSSAEYDGDILIKNMQICIDWIKTGEIPNKPQKKLPPKVKLVEST